MEFKEAVLTDALLYELLALSEDWAREESCWGYRANTAADLEGERIFLATEGAAVAGYLLGHVYRTERAASVMPQGTPCFEVEELYVVPACRSTGIGQALFRAVEDAVRGEAEYVTLSTATKNWRAILHFYLDELGLEFWSARLFRPLK